VESREQLDFLRTHGCDELQGFLFSPAVPALEIAALLERDRTLETTERWADLPWRPSGDEPAWDVKRLQETLWADAEGVAGTEETETRGARVVVLGTAGSFMLVPTLLGLGSAGGLPPQVQAHVTAALDAAGAVAPHPALPVTRSTPDSISAHKGLSATRAGLPSARHESAGQATGSVPRPSGAPSVPVQTAVPTPAAPPSPVPAPRPRKGHGPPATRGKGSAAAPGPAKRAAAAPKAAAKKAAAKKAATKKVATKKVVAKPVPGKKTAVAVATPVGHGQGKGNGGVGHG
jgi:hypothetical protein